MIGLGVSSFSHVNGTHFQNDHHYEPYIAAIDKGNLPIHRALAINDQQKMIREFILQMKIGLVNRSYFQEKFDVDIFDQFAEPLKLHDQYFTLDQDHIHVSRDGLLGIDRLLYDFFLPEHRNSRYA
jgi:oxygen-independent coproporphyrinogen-3 oxidase